MDVKTRNVNDPPTFDAAEFSVMVAHVVAHEMAHVPGAGDGEEDHAEGGLMDPMSLESAQQADFSPMTISRLRNTSSWSPE